MNTKMTKLALALGALVMTGGVWAQTTTSTSTPSTMAVTATIAAECAVANGGGLSFGTLTMLDKSNAQQASADEMNVSSFPAICTTGTTNPTFTYVSLNTSSSGTDFRLKGTNGSDFIAYTLYPSTDLSLAAIVGGTAVAHPAFIADGTTNTLALSARILAADKATKSAQAYSDTITITAGWTLPN